MHCCCHLRRFQTRLFSVQDKTDTVLELISGTGFWHERETVAECVVVTCCLMWIIDVHKYNLKFTEQFVHFCHSDIDIWPLDHAY